MGKIVDFFRGRKEGPTTPARDVRELVMPLARPAVQVVLSGIESKSYFGGSPPVGPEVQWPNRKSKPLMFLASIHLPSLMQVHAFDWIPSEGNLCFFYDFDEQPWGFDPKDKGGWAVLHVLDGEGIASPTQSGPQLRHRYMEFRRIDTFPSWERPNVQALSLTDQEADALTEIAIDSYGGSASHQLGGYPDHIQGDEMELECQLASNGIYCGNASGYRGAEAKRLKGGAEDWRLLLQIASDDELDVVWGDLGNLYFWVRKQDAMAGRFDQVWTVLQCS